MDPADVAALTELEESLWRAGTRYDRDHVERLFADDFDEFGRSGRHWSRDEAIAADGESFEAALSHVRVRGLGPDAALLTFRSETRRDGEVLAANRSSVWQRIDGEWRLRFHQGTPTR